MRYKPLGFCSFFASAVLLTGCGGGASSGPSAPGNASSLQIGQANIGFSGRISPAITTGVNAVTVTGMAGAAVTKFQLVPNRTLENTSIAYNNAGAIWLYGNGSDAAMGGVGVGTFYDASWTGDGHIVSVGLDAATDTIQIFESNYDGSSLTKLTNSTHLVASSKVSWSPTGTQMAYGTPTGIYTALPNGSGERLIVANGAQPAISPGGTQIAYTAVVGGVNQIFTVPIGGGAPTKISVGSVAKTKNCYFPTWAPGGAWIAFNVDTGSDQYIEVQQSNGSDHQYDIPRNVPAMEFDDQPSYSPDGNCIAFMRASTYRGPASLTVAGDQGQSPVDDADPNPVGLVNPAWSPFPASQLFVGSGGKMYASAAGFLWGQNGDVFSSLLTFTATTPSSATITPQGTTGNSSLVFDLAANSITGLKYTNGYYATTTTVVPGASAAISNVLVSFSATSGQVDTVAPFLATRSAAKPVSKSVGNQLVCSGKFLAIWDAQGHNLAPGGATQVVIDQSSGKLVRFN